MQPHKKSYIDSHSYWQEDLNKSPIKHFNRRSFSKRYASRALQFWRWKTFKDWLKITYLFKKKKKRNLKCSVWLDFLRCSGIASVFNWNSSLTPPQCRFQTYLVWPACSAASYWDRWASQTFPDKSLFFWNSRNIFVSNRDGWPSTLRDGGEHRVL